MAGTTEVAQDMPTRLRKAGDRVRETGDAHRLALKHRKELILTAIDDEGMSHQAVAKVLGLAKGRISAILASPDDDD